MCSWRRECEVIAGETVAWSDCCKSVCAFASSFLDEAFSWTTIVVQAKYSGYSPPDKADFHMY